MPSVDQLHAEAKIMSVKDHHSMITEQFILTTQKPEHPNQINIYAPSSNYSTYLNSHMSRIDETIQNECPDCKESPHDTQHLFNCTEKPTTLTTFSLWTQLTLGRIEIVSKLPYHTTFIHGAKILLKLT